MKFQLDKILQFKYVLLVYILAAIAVSLQLYFLPGHVYEAAPTLSYTEYNNYVIFRQSFFHLTAGKSLYTSYLFEHWDLYKYSPTFALVFGLLAYLPDVLGLSLWNLLNALVYFFAIWNLPHLTERTRVLILAVTLIELITSMQSAQSNGLMAGLMIWAFVFLERKRPAVAALMVVLSVFIKLFGIVAFALFLLYPQKWKAVIGALVSATLLFLLPLPVTGFEKLLEYYRDWGELLVADHGISAGYSVMGWLDTWFGILADKTLVLFAGVILFMLPLVQTKRYGQYEFRLLILASVLLWVVIFNHRAESPTFIIAMAGVAIWFFAVKRNTLDKVLFGAAILLTSLSATDLFPPTVKAHFLIPYVIKVVPCILIWCKLVTFDLWNENTFR